VKRNADAFIGADVDRIHFAGGRGFFQSEHRSKKVGQKETKIARREKTPAGGRVQIVWPARPAESPYRTTRRLCPADRGSLAFPRASRSSNATHETARTASRTDPREARTRSHPGRRGPGHITRHRRGGCSKATPRRATARPP
jgi:hypothetical protein